MPSDSNNDGLSLEAYRTLVGLVTQEESLLWSRNSAFLTINSGLIAILGLTSIASEKPVHLVLCFVGAVMSLLWLFVISRSEAFYNHWYEQLKVLEAGPVFPINIFGTADKYFAEGKVELGKQVLNLPRLARFRIFRALLLTSLIFLAVWIVLFVYFMTTA